MCDGLRYPWPSRIASTYIVFCRPYLMCTCVFSSAALANVDALYNLPLLWNGQRIYIVPESSHTHTNTSQWPQLSVRKKWEYDDNVPYIRNVRLLSVWYGAREQTLAASARYTNRPHISHAAVISATLPYDHPAFNSPPPPPPPPPIFPAHTIFQVYITPTLDYICRYTIYV